MVHYCIDPINQLAVILGKEETERYEDEIPVMLKPLVSSITYDEDYYIRHEIEEVEKVKNRCIITLCNSKNPDDDKVLISKELTVDSGSYIEDVNVYEGIIYTYEIDVEMEKEKQYICTYDIDGNQLSKDEIDMEKYLVSIAGMDAVYDFYVMGDYLFMDTWCGYEIVLKKTVNGYVVDPQYEKLRLTALDNVDGARTQASPNVLYDTIEREYYLFNSQDGTLEQMVIKTESDKRKGIVSGDWLVFSTENGEIYKVNLSKEE